MHRPTALAGIGDATLEAGQIGIDGEGVGGEIDQPRRDHAAPAPHLGDRRQIEVVLIGEAVGQRRRLGVGRMIVRPMPAGVEDAEALGRAAIIPYSMPLWTILTK